jgi:hypothetical protein
MIANENKRKQKESKDRDMKERAAINWNESIEKAESMKRA